jgi:HSP20 family molecular chaperone IbpA
VANAEPQALRQSRKNPKASEQPHKFPTVRELLWQCSDRGETNMDVEATNENNEVEQNTKTECNFVGKINNSNKRWLVVAVAGTALVAAFAIGFATNSAVDYNHHHNHRLIAACPQDVFNAVNNVQPDWVAPLWQPVEDNMLPLIPKISTNDSAKQVVVTANIPAMNADNVKVRVEGRSLMISARQEKDKIINRDRKNAQEQCAMSTFQATLPLPQNIRPDKMQTNFKDGVLTISIPKT